MFIRCFQQIGEGKSIRMHHHWVPMSEISPHMPVAVMASEDQRFLLHHGFDYQAIEKAALHNLEGKKKHGASTISQQTAKNVFLWPGRSWVRKGFEAYFTVLIEFMWSKQRIMEVYLNSIEMGDGIYGGGPFRHRCGRPLALAVCAYSRHAAKSAQVQFQGPQCIHAEETFADRA